MFCSYNAVKTINNAGDYMNKYGNCKKPPGKKNFMWLAFGLGCVIAVTLPAVWVTRILAVVVIILGVIVAKCS